FVRSFFFQAEDGIRDFHVTGVQTCALPIFAGFGVQADGNAAAVVTSVVWDGTEYLFNQPTTATCEAVTTAPVATNLDSNGWTFRSEERRVGKEGGARGGAARERKECGPVIR